MVSFDQYIVIKLILSNTMAEKRKLQIEDYEEISPKKKPRRHYSLDFKLQVISEAKNTYNRTVATKYNITEKMVRDWRSNELKMKNEISSPSKHYRLSGGGRPVLNKDLEEELFDFIKFKRDKNHRVTRKYIQNLALELAQNGNYKSFNASPGWLNNFMNRYGLSLRRKTHQGQRLPADLIPKVTRFFAYLRQYYQKFTISPKEIFACDETSVLFENIGTTTVDFKNQKINPKGSNFS